MAAAANYAWVNRSSMTFLARQVSTSLRIKIVIMLILFYLKAFAKMFRSTPDDLDMHVIYDVSHNIAKVLYITKRAIHLAILIYFSI